MATKFVRKTTARLYGAAQGGSYGSVLIFGDTVETGAAPLAGRVPVTFRGRPGFLAEADLTTSAALELYFIDVGQGDATFIVTPARKTILIDGGVDKRALGFLAWKYRLAQAAQTLVVDLLVVSHADADHLAGLAPIVTDPRIDVRRIVHSGIATFRKGAFKTRLGDLSPDGRHVTTRHDRIGELAGLPLSDGFRTWEQAVAAEAGVGYGAVDTETGTIDVGDPSVRLEVLGPRLDGPQGAPSYRWFGDEAHTINGHSVILRLTHGNVRVLFAGDINVEGARHLLEDADLAARLDAHVLKAPHHGSHEFHPPFLDAVRPQIAVISSGDEPDHGHPRAIFIGSMGKAMRSRRPLLFSTEIAADFVDAGEPQAPPAPGSLGDLDPDAPGAEATARTLFKRRLHGMINVRSDGTNLYAARRVKTGYWWEAYGPLPAVPRWEP